MPEHEPKRTVARRHHYVPAFWLAGFTPTGQRDSEVTVIDKSQGRVFRAKPTSIGSEKDLYRVNHPDMEPDIVEQAYAQVESTVAPALKRITAGGRDDADIAVVLNLVALLALRVPGVRDWVARGVEDLASRLMDMLMSKRGRSSYEEFIRSRGADPDKSITFDQMKDSWERGRSRPKANPGFVTTVTTGLMPHLYDWLSLRTWKVVGINRTDSGPVIGCDRPVCIYWTKKPRSLLLGPGFGMRNTEVWFALDRRHVLIGTWENYEFSNVPGRFIAANANEWAVNMADRFLFSPSKQFFIGRFGEEIRRSTDLVAEWERSKPDGRDS